MKIESDWVVKCHAAVRGRDRVHQLPLEARDDAVGIGAEPVQVHDVVHRVDRAVDEQHRVRRLVGLGDAGELAGAAPQPATNSAPSSAEHARASRYSQHASHWSPSRSDFTSSILPIWGLPVSLSSTDHMYSPVAAAWPRRVIRSQPNVAPDNVPGRSLAGL